VLCPGHAHLPRAEVTTERAGETEVARIAGDRVLVNQTGLVEHEGLRSQALAVVILAGQVYELTDDGLRRR